jgi:hypothetical protein
MAEDIDKKRSKEIFDLEVRIKKLQILIAIVTLAGILITTINTWKLSATKSVIDTTSTQVDDIKSLLKEKLLEGEWVYSAQYEKYYEEPDPQSLYGGGRALVIWKQRESRYDVNLSYSIKRIDSQDTLMTVVFQGALMAGLDGSPPTQPFVMDNFQVLNRLHYQGKEHTLPAYQFKDCNYIKNGERIDKIVCILETPNSRSVATFKWKTALH